MLNTNSKFLTDTSKNFDIVRNGAFSSGVHAKKLLARKMMLAGYATSIIVIESGLSYKQINNIKIKMRDEEGVLVDSDTRNTKKKSSTAILKSRLNKQHSSILMSIYRALTINDQKRNNFENNAVFCNVQILELTKSYSIYCSIIDELDSFINQPQKVLLSISDAWRIASDLRSKEAFFIQCSSCKNDYIASENQTTQITCPFCS